MTPEARLALVDELMARYNAKDADGYAALMTEDAVEAGYRGAVLRNDREGFAPGLKRCSPNFPKIALLFMLGMRSATTSCCMRKCFAATRPRRSR